MLRPRTTVRLRRRFAMPVRKVKGGWQWGTVGKVWPTKKEAQRQALAIRLKYMAANRQVPKEWEK